MLLFSDRLKAEEEFEKWCKKRGVKNCCSSVLAWLQEEGRGWADKLNENFRSIKKEMGSGRDNNTRGSKK